MTSARGGIELEALARIRSATSSVVSLYLNTRWADEHQRERVRIFLKNELARIRRAGATDVDRDDSHGSRRKATRSSSSTAFLMRTAALFACRALGLHEIVPASHSRTPSSSRKLLPVAAHARR
jgi:hypothetical protein